MGYDVRAVPVTLIDPGDNDRKTFDPGELAELAASIQSKGLIQPVTLREVGSRYECVAGERRLRAIRDVLKWEAIPAIVRTLSDDDAADLMLLENIQRANLNAVEEAKAYQKRMSRQGLSIENVAERAQRPVEHVRKRLALLQLVPEAQHLVSRGQLPLGHAEMLASLDVNRQRIALRILSNAQTMPTNSDFRTIVSGLLEQQRTEDLFDFETFWAGQVAEDKPVLNGYKARVDVPKSGRIPAPRAVSDDSAGDVLMRYIGDLMERGLTEEAAAVGAAYEVLVHRRWITVARKPVTSLGPEG